MGITDLFRRVKDSKARFDSNYERAGHYLMFITGAKRGVTRTNRDFSAVEKVCIHVFGDTENADRHKVGENASHLLMDDQDPTPGNIKAMIMNVFACDETEVTEELAGLVFGVKIDMNSGATLGEVDSPLIGMVVEMKNRDVVAKGSGQTITLKNYVRAVEDKDVREILTVSECELYDHLIEQTNVPF